MRGICFSILCGFICLFTACGTLPERISQLYIPFNAQAAGDSVWIHVKNISYSPLSIYITEKGKIFSKKHEFLLEANTEKNYGFLHNDSIDLGTAWMFGNPDIPSEIPSLQLPFPRGKTYQIIQGFEGEFSHALSSYSRYALDFEMKEGDTICGVSDGYVVGSVAGYSKGGKSKKWEAYGNFLTLYHPEGNFYTQYVHLQHNGILVKLSERIKQGQPIALSGNTGYSTVPHLHFNVLIPTNETEGLKSAPYSFKKYPENLLYENIRVGH